MRHIIFFAYIVDIIICAIGITIILLTERQNKTELHLALKKFMIGMVIMSLYDFVIYYMDYIIGNMQFDTLLRFGNCIIAANFYLWLCLAEKIVNGNTYNKFKILLRNYVILFTIIWVICRYCLSEKSYYFIEWILLGSDIAMILLFLTGTVVYIGEAVWSRRDNKTICYLVIVTSVLFWNYTSYFWGDASTYWGNSEFIRTPLDLTILFWCLSNAVTLFFIYKVDFSAAYNYEKQQKEFNLDERLEGVATQYELTYREKDLLALIYEGKSNAEIAKILFISESTVKTHIYNIFKKLSIKNRIQLVCIIRGEEHA
ncbi:MAG: response regulator transcription factor [Aminipila sp.]